MPVWLRTFIRSIVTCSGIAFAVPLLQWTFDPRATLHRLAIQYLYSLAYSICIGGMLFTAVPRLWMWSDRFGAVARWVMRIAGVAIGTTVGCLVTGTLLMVIVGREYNFWAEFTTSLKIALIVAGVVVSFVATFETYKYRLQATAMELKSKELERERALGVATQMRLSSLQARVHPHFLFNTINSISSLVHDDPERAEDMLTRMAALLRFSLDAAQPGLVSVERELSIVRDYLEIEKARFGERLRYEISGLGPDQSAVLVPPLSIQTLVENSIKYAVNARREGASIRIALTLGAENCVVEVSDDGPGFGSLKMLAGHGLDNLEERLSMLFGERGRLHIESTSKRTSVCFTVPLRRERTQLESGEHASITRVSR